MLEVNPSEWNFLLSSKDAKVTLVLARQDAERGIVSIATHPTATLVGESRVLTSVES